ncbi:hypothetical protein BU23DRAFT_574873 [Bimuria novae-zelandiae CBS 107.79]|uniref:Uncharacterized protein n=1 Tax=Bimuria novae-zelandiae CBS 107.79 TaxID=1447943 RepID=A0A6A5UM32_9PLEO|nr:hypothetical protein BU23DRAFT_574873 [Bimuria novae-zelandiae CBS 107.79]
MCDHSITRSSTKTDESPQLPSLDALNDLVKKLAAIKEWRENIVTTDSLPPESPNLDNVDVETGSLASPSQQTLINHNHFDHGEAFVSEPSCTELSTTPSLSEEHHDFQLSTEPAGSFDTQSDPRAINPLTAQAKPGFNQLQQYHGNIELKSDEQAFFLAQLKDHVFVEEAPGPGFANVEMSATPDVETPDTSLKQPESSSPSSIGYDKSIDHGISILGEAHGPKASETVVKYTPDAQKDATMLEPPEAPPPSSIRSEKSLDDSPLTHGEEALEPQTSDMEPNDAIEEPAPPPPVACELRPVHGRSRDR